VENATDNCSQENQEAEPEHASESCSGRHASASHQTHRVKIRGASSPPRAGGAPNLKLASASRSTTGHEARGARHPSPPTRHAAAVATVEPIAARDIALEMLVNRALNTQDQKLLALMVKRVGVALRLQRNNGVVRSLTGPGQYMLWEVER